MTVDFGEVRSAVHSGGTLPDGWMEDERAREYVVNHVDLTDLAITFDHSVAPVFPGDRMLVGRRSCTLTITADGGRICLLRASGGESELAWQHLRTGHDDMDAEVRQLRSNIQRSILFGRGWPWRR